MRWLIEPPAWLKYEWATFKAAQTEQLMFNAWLTYWFILVRDHRRFQVHFLCIYILEGQPSAGSPFCMLHGGNPPTPIAAPAAVRLGPVVQPTNLWFWPTFRPHSSRWKVLETHSFPMNPISSSQAVVSSLQAYLLHPAAGHIWIFHYGTIRLQICHRIRFMRVREDVHTFLYMSVIAAGCLHWPDMQISFYMINYKPLGWICREGHVVSPLGRL